MLDSTQEALSFVEKIDYEAFSRERMRVLSVIKAIEIVGEAAKNVSEEVCQKYPDVPWSDIAGMRDRLTHAYFDINLNIVWQTLQKDLPELRQQLTLILAKQ